MAYDESNPQPGPARPAETVNASRRRFTRGIAPAVLGTVSSSPVLARNTNYACTISGAISGNLSFTGGVDCSTLGKSPEFLRTGTWPALSKGTLRGTTQCYRTVDGPSATGTLFNGFTVNTVAMSSSPVLFYCLGGVIYHKDDLPTGGSPTTKVSMYEILMRTTTTAGGTTFKPNNGAICYEFARQTVAALVSASAGGGYPLTVEQVVRMFNAVHNGSGTYEVKTGVFWNRDKVQQYFEYLHNSGATIFPG